MIYKYLKEKLESVSDNPTEYGRMLYDAEKDIERIKREYRTTWRYCLGCRGYVKRAEAYEDGYKGHTILRCCNCHAIIEFPEYDVYLD